MSTAPSTIAVPTGSGTALTLNEGQQAAATSHCFVTAYDTITNPSSSMTRPADANAYSVGDFIANSVTAGSVAVPSFTIANSGGGVLIPRIRLYSLVYAGWDGIAIQVGLWAANHPTYVNGDNGAYSIATQSQSWLGFYDVTLSQMGDGAVGIAIPAAGPTPAIRLAAQTIYWDMKILSAPVLSRQFLARRILLFQRS